jgi:hypothetical protein
MRPDRLSVHDVFQKERRYVVPLYQRACVWSEFAPATARVNKLDVTSLEISDRLRTE